jgi:flagellar hook-associated protein 1 FlgK
MSLSHALSNALTGLGASSRMAEVVSSNLANAMTDGYGRRSVQLSSQDVGGRGAGVNVDGISRFTDRSILSDRRMSESRLAAQSTLDKTFRRLETAVGVTGDATAIGGKINALEKALVAASADPSNETRLAAVVDRFGEMTSSIRDSAGEIRKLRQEADQSIRMQVDTLNADLQQMELLNGDIVRGNNRGDDVSALLDQRQKVVDRISTIVPIREMDRRNGEIALVTVSGATLIDGTASVVGFQSSPTITPDMSLAGGSLSGLSLNGQAITSANGVGRFSGGSLGAAFGLRDETLVAAQTGLDALARDLVERFQDPATDFSLAIGDAGLLSDSGAAFDPSLEVGLSSRIAVNAAIDPARGGALFRLRDGVNATTPGPVGSATQIDAWLDALDRPRATGPGGPQRSASENASAFVSDIGAMRVSNEDDMSYTAARFESIRQSELALGVDSDAETQLLLLIEQSFAANARVIQTVDSLFRTLMEI